MNYPQNRTDFTVLAGTPQFLQFFVRDLDRQITDTTGVTLTITVASTGDEAMVLLVRDLVLTDATQGLYGLTLAPLDTLDWPLEPVRYIVSLTRADGTETLLWTDRDYTPYGILYVKAGPIPAPPQPLSLDPSTFVITDQWAASSALKVSQLAGGAQTLAVYGAGYNGQIKVQGTLLAQPNADSTTWFDVTTVTIDVDTPLTGVMAITTAGLYTYIRVLVAVVELTPAFTSVMPVPIPVGGAVTNILVTC